MSADTTTPADPLAEVVDLLREIRDWLADRPADATPPALLTQDQAAAYLGMSRSAWYRAVAAGEVPWPVELPGGTGPRVRLRDLERYVERLKARRRKGERP